MVCTSENLIESDPKKKTKLLVFRAYPDTEEQTYYAFSLIEGGEVSEIPPELSTITFKNAARLRLLRRMLLNTLGDSTNDQTKNTKQEAELFGVNQKTIRKYTLKLNPALIKVNVDGLDKEADFKKIGVKAKGEKAGSQESGLTIGDLKKDAPSPSSGTNVDPDKPIPKRGGGIGFFGWFVIVLVVGLIAWGIWFFMRREQLKEQAREDMMYNTNEMEKYE